MTLAHYFRQAGYETGYIGKWHLADDRSHGPVRPEQRGGYEYWLASNLLEFTSDAYDCVLHDHDGRPIKLPGYRVDAMTDAAIRFIDRHQSQPFFLFISYLEPHHQNQRDDYPAPDGCKVPWVNRWIPGDLAALRGTSERDLAGYFGMVKRLDDALGRLRDAIKSLSLEENTVVLFTSDHGCHFKTRNGEYKRSCHESSIRVPTALAGPGFHGAGEIPGLVSLIDLPPTLLDAAGLPVPTVMQGRSIVPLARGEKCGEFKDVFVQISESEVGRAIRTRRWKYGICAPQANSWTDATGAFWEEEHFYDLYEDPHELTNLVGNPAYQKVAYGLRKRLIQRMQDAGEEVPEIRLCSGRAEVSANGLLAGPGG
jgi:arylsulfatase A-like enzyme